MKGKEIINHAVRAEMPDMEQLRENSIRQATAKTTVKLVVWAKRLVPTAACIAVIIVAVLAFPSLNNRFNGDLISEPDTQSDQSQTGEKNPSVSEYGVYIPAIELPKNTDGVEMDMKGLFVYQGRIYTQTAWYYNEEVSSIKNLIGERLGYAKGNINEWSKQDEYAVEFAGSITGDVYTVKGYDKQFRLCVMGSYVDNDGNHVDWVNFYENLNGIGLTSGSDLFGDRLMLRENWKQVKSQKNDDWDYDKQTFTDLMGVTDSDINAFISALYSDDFEYVYETVGIDNFYTAEQTQAHLYFHMEDNTVIELRLFEGGYVGYRHLGWYFVKMPGEAFDVIFNACK